MKIEAEQRFILQHPGTPAEALAFLRDPARSLAGVRFLQDLQVQGRDVRAVLLVNVPMLGEVDLPLHSRVTDTPGGARLDAQALPDERAWIELNGDGQADGSTLTYAFRFTAHLSVPSAEKWGGAAFEKMMRAAAERTLARLARELPEGVTRSLPAPD
ncbi:DUF3809 domain-containing protein [Deinococcus aquiradiocola]|uniref:DUF3809 domain-containing protein n=1 Tax=Deinococcus aquiradiocola TaxID=393059 RepID=A0A917URS9_9DEIO|nr:DUF3809 domain-containing protein [Deinococcus aquiradiocola]GGJ80067.1 hypothetical protein GCM10008939_24960 [Deinococcus aquiradiocola]